MSHRHRCSLGPGRAARAAGLALLLVLGGCERAAARGQGGGRDGGGPGPFSVVVAAARQESLARTVPVTGTLAAWEQALVSVEAEGRLAQVRVDLGTPVKRGELLAQIAPGEYAIRRAQAQAELTAAQADFDRTEKLLSAQIGTRRELDEARRRLAVARTAAELAAKKLADTTLQAPIAGKIARRLVNTGEYVRAGTAAFEIVLGAPLKLSAEVPERYSADIQVGDRVAVQGDALGALVLTGEVVRIGPAVSATTRAFPIEARIDNPEERVKPGTFARATITTATLSRAITVPEEAITELAGNPRVFVVDGGLARERPVVLDRKVGGRAVVSKGLAAGERVVVTGVNRLTDGAAVAVRPDARP